MFDISLASLSDIQELRNEYIRQMNCQIIHDSIHRRPNWTTEYSLRLRGQNVGYGSVAVLGPWSNKPSAYEFYLRPEHDSQLLLAMRAFLDQSQCSHIEVQTNDRTGNIMLASFAKEIQTEAILFEDLHTTHHSFEGARLREPTFEEEPDLDADERSWRIVIEIEHQVVARGGVLFHYNPPYGDIYMEVEPDFRRRGIGSYLVQELKALCRRRGKTPACRCNVGNVASQRTLQRAGFVPCGNIMFGRLARGES